MPRKSSSSRIPRQEWHCTCCGERLPKYRNNWGLIWENKVTGMCRTCLIKIRDAIGYYTEDNPKPALPRKRKKKDKKC